MQSWGTCFASLIEPHVSNKFGATKRLEKFPIYCPACGYFATIDPPTSEGICGLYEHSLEIEWNHEREMLLRLDALVRRFPNSVHREKVRVTTAKAGPDNLYYEVLNAEPVEEQPIIHRHIGEDPEFEAALNADLELRDWMKGISFLLYARLRSFVDEVCYFEKYAIEELRCPSCGDEFIAIDRKFFATL